MIRVLFSYDFLYILIKLYSKLFLPVFVWVRYVWARMNSLCSILKKERIKMYTVKYLQFKNHTLNGCNSSCTVSLHLENRYRQYMSFLVLLIIKNGKNPKRTRIINRNTLFSNDMMRRSFPVPVIGYGFQLAKFTKQTLANKHNMDGPRNKIE